MPSRTINWSTPRARDIARELVRSSGDRWTHVRSVGRAADDLAAQGLDIPEDVISAAWLHDIGYATRLADTGFHPIDGARWLAAKGAPMGIVALVAYHSGARFEAEERDLTDELTVFPQPDEEMLDLLTMLDMLDTLSTRPSRDRTSTSWPAQSGPPHACTGPALELLPPSPWTARDLGRYD